MKSSAFKAIILSASASRTSEPVPPLPPSVRSSWRGSTEKNFRGRGISNCFRVRVWTGRDTKQVQSRPPSRFLPPHQWHRWEMLEYPRRWSRLIRLTIALGFASTALAISCDNFGISLANGTCACPPGFGGKDCSLAACGGDIFQGTARSVSQSSGSSPSSNITSCGCENGWTGLGCNGMWLLLFLAHGTP